MSSGTRTFVNRSPVFASLQAVGVKCLPFFLNAVFPHLHSFSANPSIHAVFRDFRLWQVFRERETQREKNQTIPSIRQPTQTHVGTLHHLHQLSQFSFFLFSRRHLCSQVENTPFTTKAQKNHLALKNRKARQAFKVYLHRNTLLFPRFNWPNGLPGICKACSSSSNWCEDIHDANGFHHYPVNIISDSSTTILQFKRGKLLLSSGAAISKHSWCKETRALTDH